MIPPLPTGQEETHLPPEGGDKEMLFPLVSYSPISCLSQWYANEASKTGEENLFNSNRFICWHDQGKPHLKWTALFVCPLTAEVFTAAPYRTWERMEKEPVLEKKLWWFHNKTAAKNAVAGRALDCLAFREYKDRFQRLSCAVPYEIVCKTTKDNIDDPTLHVGKDEDDDDSKVHTIVGEGAEDEAVGRDDGEGKVGYHNEEERPKLFSLPESEDLSAPCDSGVAALEEQEQNAKQEEGNEEELPHKNARKSAGNESDFLDENGEVIYNSSSEWERQLLGLQEREHLDRLRRECAVYRQELKMEVVQEEDRFDQKERCEEEYSWQVQPGARVAHNPSAQNKISEYYRFWYKIPLQSKQYVAWRDNSGHWVAALVCPQNGELFVARGVSREEAEARAAKQALDVIQERQNQNAQVQDSERVILLEGIIQPELLKVQRFAVDPIPSLRVLIQMSGYDDMMGIDRIGEVPGEHDTDKFGPYIEFETPLKALEHWCQFYYGINVKQDSFFTFPDARGEGLFSCAWIYPFTGEVFPTAPCLMDQDWYMDETDTHYFFVGKSQARMGAAAVAIDCLRFRKQAQVLTNLWTTQVPYLEPRTEAYLDNLPNELADVVRDKIPQVVQQPRIRRDVTVVLAEQDNKERTNEHDDVDVILENHDEVVVDDGEKMGVDEQVRECVDDQDQKAFFGERGGNCAKNPVKMFAFVRYGAKDISADRFLLWMKLGPNQQVVWACAFHDDESGELFLASPYNDKEYYQEPATGVWWFRNSMYARRSAAAKACDCFAARTGNKVAPRYCEEEPSLERVNISLEDLEAIGLWDSLRRKPLSQG